MTTQYIYLVEFKNRQCKKAEKLRNLAKIRTFLKNRDVKEKTQNFLVKYFIRAKEITLEGIDDD